MSLHSWMTAELSYGWRLYHRGWASTPWWLLRLSRRSCKYHIFIIFGCYTLHKTLNRSCFLCIWQSAAIQHGLHTPLTCGSFLAHQFLLQQLLIWSSNGIVLGNRVEWFTTLANFENGHIAADQEYFHEFNSKILASFHFPPYGHWGNLWLLSFRIVFS